MAARWPRSPRSLPENEDHVLVDLTGRTVGAEARLVPSPNPFAATNPTSEQATRSNL